MSLLELALVLLAVALVASLALVVVGRGARGARADGRVAFALRVLAVVATTVTAGRVSWWAWQEGTGAFTLALVGVPMAAALLVLGFTVAGRPSGVVTWTAAVVMLAWSLLTGLGAGLFFLGPAVLMVVAAVASTCDRVEPRMAWRSSGPR